MKNLIALILLISLQAQADETTRLEYQMDEVSKFVLYYDFCFKAEPTEGYVATVVNVKTGQVAHGCWRKYSQSTYEVLIETGSNKPSLYVFERSKFWRYN